MEKITERQKREKRIARGKESVWRRASKIGAATRYDFGGGVLTPYGGLLPLAGLWEKLGFLELVGKWLTVGRQPESLSNGQFVVGTVLFSRIFAIPPRALCAGRRDGAGGDWEPGAIAGAKHVLAVSGLAAIAQ